MSNLIQIKRSLNTAVPTSLANGELAFTANGDVLYIAAGSGNTTIVSQPYTVFSVPNALEFTTTPAINPTLNTVAGLNTCTLYSNIMYAERFTNGPYSIQNNGDQIKITLNVALD